MDWLSDIVKHITLSRSLTIASLITSAVLLFGPKYFPGDIEAVPFGWNWAVMAVFVFTTSLVIFWVIKEIGSLLNSGFRSAKKALPLRPASQDEDSLLYVLAQHADQTLNLEELYRRNQGEISKLQLLDLSKRLCKKGYVTENFLDENLFYLTEKGRRYALKLEARVHAEQSKNEA